MKFPTYRSICPLCKNPICYYCSRYVENSNNGRCCPKTRLKCMFFQDRLRYINNVNYVEPINTFKEAFIFFIIPGLNIYYFIFDIVISFYLDMTIKNEECSSKGEIPTYNKRIENISNNLEALILQLICFQSLILGMPFIIIYTYFIIIVLLISIPFKFYPLKYLLGFIDGDYYDFY